LKASGIIESVSIASIAPAAKAIDIDLTGGLA